MVELIHRYRPSSNYDETREEWADSIQKNGIRPRNEELNGPKPEIYLYHPEDPPDESLTDYTCVSVEIGKDELSVRSWWTADDSSGKRDYEDWNPEK